MNDTNSDFPLYYDNISNSTLSLAFTDDWLPALYKLSNETKQQQGGGGGSVNGNDTDTFGMDKSTMFDDNQEFDFILDKPYIRIIFLTLYTTVFCLCFFGNLAVVLVVTIHPRMRNITKFCLGNLAVANLCVSIFCVYQNLSTYFIKNWIFGNILCKMYHFINSLSHTASVLILVVICVERYLAILHPFLCKKVLTLGRLRGVMCLVWISSVALCSPRLYYFNTMVNYIAEEKREEIICVPIRNLYNSHTADMINFFALFFLPLIIITVLYTKVGLYLWQSSLFLEPPKMTVINSYGRGRGLNDSTMMSELSSFSSSSDSEQPSVMTNVSSQSKICRAPSTIKQKKFESIRTTKVKIKKKQRHRYNYSSSPKPASPFLSQNSMSLDMDPNLTDVIQLTHDSPGVKQFNLTIPCILSDQLNKVNRLNGHGQNSYDLQFNSRVQETSFNKSDNSLRGGKGLHETSGALMRVQRQIYFYNNRRDQLLKQRQAVVKMLFTITISFGLLNLPFHLRKLFQNWYNEYDFSSSFSFLITPISFLLIYTNCAINPILYAFMSKSFRTSFKDLIRCRTRTRRNETRMNSVRTT